MFFKDHLSFEYCMPHMMLFQPLKRFLEIALNHIASVTGASCAVPEKSREVGTVSQSFCFKKK